MIQAVEGATIQIDCGLADGTSPPKFSGVIYNGGPLVVERYDQPIIVDLDTATFLRRPIVNLDHDVTKRVGHVTAFEARGGRLYASGILSAATKYRDEVANSARDGFDWQSSLEANPGQLEFLAAGRSEIVNGRPHVGPAWISRKAVIRGFAFVSQGADQNTEMSIAAKFVGLATYVEPALTPDGLAACDQIYALAVVAYAKGDTPNVETHVLASAIDHLGLTPEKFKADVDRLAAVYRRGEAIQILYGRYFQAMKIGDDISARAAIGALAHV